MRNVLLILCVLLLVACKPDGPKQLICENTGGLEAYHSDPKYSIVREDATFLLIANDWQLTYYTPRPGDECYIHRYTDAELEG